MSVGETMKSTPSADAPSAMEGRGEESPPPLAVDLDHTLLRTDTLYETLAFNAFSAPLATAKACLGVFRGRAELKRRLSALGVPPVDTMPVNEPLADYLKTQKAAGRDIHLATAADERIATKVADRFPVFSSVIASSDGVNLKGPAKAAKLQNLFPDGFVYAGDSAADLHVWKVAAGAIPVGVQPNVAEELRKTNATIEISFTAGGEGRAMAWLKAMRLHQWTKNFLIFAPLLLAHAYGSIETVLTVIAGFIIAGVAASGTYFLNDLSDLDADRRHRTKRDRPFAAGAISVALGAIASVTMILSALVAAALLSPAFAASLVAYLATTLAYSFRVKRIPFCGRHHPLRPLRITPRHGGGADRRAHVAMAVGVCNVLFLFTFPREKTCGAHARAGARR